MLAPSTLAPAPINTPSLDLGNAILLFFASWPPSVTECSIETIIATTAVSPITRGRGGGMGVINHDALPMRAARMDIHAKNLDTRIWKKYAEITLTAHAQVMADAVGLERPEIP